ncbi:putative Na(+)/H(+) antiporter 2 [Gluconacetobacter sp. SXCC-1]|uniref:Sodium:proton antiporter n=2 Tax=Komagataeibacter rhaeticus TaxID=215221 RepID=A0A181CBB0_9PROT|nr:sodium:proton antiporter [Komagataeibacter rhaeticus]ATU74260.1 sodium:proton antiporter [Komagataeibacter xylinus]EGG74799.1 putative Na(+)/H(+) antiporter 2 [Gluconacetobacter sp. SXCC-1]QIP35618.1 sodium:proton antiporter [Komagataeibacter rhaeticus]QOC45375.1 sodium:proton antiporter [Komagataeibacter rhaeticus]WPP22219.1 sodium:proton antiporter [Komagataeibacter rhaeticus]
MQATNLAIGILCVLGGGIAAQWVAWRFRLPAIVLLFALGLIYGPGLGLLHPAAAIGPYFHPLVSMAVAFIVFEGGLALDLRQWRESGEGVLRLTAAALPINWVLGSIAAHYIGHLPWGTAWLFGAIVVVTGPTVVLPLLRHTKLRPRVAAFLRWEAIVNDPIAAILATLVLECLLLRPSHTAGMSLAAVEIGPHLLFATMFSIACGVFPAMLIKFLSARDLLPEILRIPIILAFAMGVAAFCNLIMQGAGLMAATVFGMALANLQVTGISELQRIKESLGVIVVSCLFVLLTADLQRTLLAQLSLPIMALTFTVMFVVRPLGIFLSTIGASMSWQERLFVGWIAPRGIVAAAVAGVVGLQLREAGYPGANLITPAVFALIASTMILHGFSLRPLARALRLTLSDEPALAIMGANAWSTNLARVVHDQGIPVLLVDTYAPALNKAAKLGVPILSAELLSDAGQESLEERPADYLIAATPDAIYNGLVCARMAPDLGRQRVFQVSPGIARLDLYHGLSRDSRGKVLGEPGWNFSMIDSLYAQGWRFASHTMRADMGEEQLLQGPAMLFMIIRKGTAIWICSAEDAIPAEAAAGDIIIRLVPPDAAVARPPAGQRGVMPA